MSQELTQVSAIETGHREAIRDLIFNTLAFCGSTWEAVRTYCDEFDLDPELCEQIRFEAEGDYFAREES